jgi:hypothetical protein
MNFALEEYRHNRMSMPQCVSKSTCAFIHIILLQQYVQQHGNYITMSATRSSLRNLQLPKDVRNSMDAYRHELGNKVVTAVR